jgi:hypothetical protein
VLVSAACSALSEQAEVGAISSVSHHKSKRLYARLCCKLVDGHAGVCCMVLLYGSGTLGGDCRISSRLEWFLLCFVPGDLVKGCVSPSSPWFKFTTTFWLDLIFEKNVNGSCDGIADLQVILEQVHCASKSSPWEGFSTSPFLTVIEKILCILVYFPEDGHAQELAQC